MINLIKKIKEYEIGLIDKIDYYLNTYTFDTNEKLKDAVRLWFIDKEECIKRYGHISFWYVNRITDMSRLFSYREEFNEDISRWDVSNVENINNIFQRCNILEQYKPNFN